LSWHFGYSGPAEEAEELLAPFNAIEAAGEAFGDFPFPEISNAMSNGYEVAGCAPSKLSGTSTVLNGQYNITTQRRIFDSFRNMAVEHPELAAVTRVFNEGYSTKAVREGDADATSYAHRQGRHIIFHLAQGAEDLGLKDEADAWAKRTWDLWLEGEGPGGLPQTYPNYAQGMKYETLESIYGYEEWRIPRLLDVKAEYDPNNRFRWYVPLIK
jgi:hypothetical protein